MTEGSIKVIAYEIEYGYPESRRRTIPGYLLDNGTVLLDSERDADGSYIGGAGVDGMFLKTPERYTPIYDGDKITAFSLVKQGGKRNGN